MTNVANFGLTVEYTNRGNIITHANPGKLGYTTFTYAPGVEHDLRSVLHKLNNGSADTVVTIDGPNKSGTIHLVPCDMNANDIAAAIGWLDSGHTVVLDASGHGDGAYFRAYVRTW